MKQIALATLVLLVSMPLVSQADEAEDLAKQLANPISSLSAPTSSRSSRCHSTASGT